MKVKYIGEKSSPFTVINGKVYECIGTEGNNVAYRIIDETGEDYLYPVSQFVVLEK